jgi:hydrogenase maturation protease
MRPLVIGLGNTLAGDDGAGPAVAGRLAGRPDLEVRIVRQILPELAADVAASSRVVFVDASAVDRRVRVVALAPAAPAGRPAGAHSLRPEDVLALARDLYDHCPPAFLVAVPSRDFALGESLSATSRRYLPAALRAVERLIAAAPADLIPK